MLKKNVYLVYPAGYGGNYVNWALSISDLDTRQTCVQNPINTNKSNLHGGVGTSHLHERVPTHQGYSTHVNWVLYNRPTEPKIYIINAEDALVSNIIVELFSHDPTGVVICIHNNDNEIIKSYSEINMVTKWPTFIAGRWAATGIKPVFDPYNIDPKSYIFRNWAVDNPEFMWHFGKLDKQQILDLASRKQEWYRVRHLHQPHEVNTSTYLVPDNAILDRVYQLSSLDVASDRLPGIIEDILGTSGISDNYNTEYLKQFHHNYVDVQTNLQWFDSYQHWEQTGELDEYLTSHGIIEAQLIRRILARIDWVELTENDKDRWLRFYETIRGIDWPDSVNDEYDYYNLPDWIQKEIQKFGYKFKITSKPNQDMLDLDWRNSNIHKINDVFQKNKNNNQVLV